MTDSVRNFSIRNPLNRLEVKVDESEVKINQLEVKVNELEQQIVPLGVVDIEEQAGSQVSSPALPSQIRVTFNKNLNTSVLPNVILIQRPVAPAFTPPTSQNFSPTAISFETSNTLLIEYLFPTSPPPTRFTERVIIEGLEAIDGSIFNGLLPLNTYFEEVE